MSAPKTKVALKDDGVKKGIQLIVFSPINADPEDEDNRIYMVCPSSLKVVEVIEKFGEEAQEYLQLLGRHKKQGSARAEDFSEDVESIEDISDDLIEDNSGASISSRGEIKTLQSELDEDIVTFASEALGDIFPETGERDQDYVKENDVDLADALALLDQEDDESFSGLDDFKDANDDLPAL